MPLLARRGSEWPNEGDAGQIDTTRGRIEFIGKKQRAFTSSFPFLFHSSPVISFPPPLPSSLFAQKERTENSLSSKVNASLWLCLNQLQGIKFLLKTASETSKRQANNEFKRKRWYKIHGCDSILLSLIIRHVTNALTKWSLYRLDETNTVLQPVSIGVSREERERRERERDFAF